MGRSINVHVIGVAIYGKGENQVEKMCMCMNKMEMAQEKIKMAKEGTPVEYWYAQTLTGCRMIGTETPLKIIQDYRVKHQRLVDCPICATKGCTVCNRSGKTKNGYWNQWRDWQLNEMRMEAAA